MKEYVNCNELIELIQSAINEEIGLGINNKDRYHHISMQTTIKNGIVNIEMLDCIALDEQEYYYILNSTYEMDYNDKFNLLFKRKINLKKYYEGMVEDNCVKQYLSKIFDVKKLVK